VIALLLLLSRPAHTARCGRTRRARGPERRRYPGRPRRALRTGSRRGRSVRSWSLAAHHRRAAAPDAWTPRTGRRRDTAPARRPSRRDSVRRAVRPDGPGWGRRGRGTTDETAPRRV